ncbi:MAG: TIGR03617 family F420-dependent LLM class oxidoreductase, partial [Dehalococcoidia bacterium]
YTAILGYPLEDVGRQAALSEELGFDGVGVGEAAHDPFLPLALVAEHTSTIKLGTTVAIAFPRSPMVVAATSWDLQAFSRGRFELGLGTQVKGHNERRFSTPWGPPIPRLREYVQSLRAIWDCFQNGTKLDYRGEHYTFTLMTPNFNPGPIEHPTIPVLGAAVTPGMARLTGEVMDGMLLHPLCSPRYLKEVLVPAVQEGAKKAGRSLDGFEIVGGSFLVTGRTDADLERSRERVRRQLAFYASTRTYKVVMDAHGWGATTERLHELSLKGQTGGGEGMWREMAALFDDEMLEQFAVVATYDDLADRIKERYGDTLTRMALTIPVRDDESQDAVREIVRRLQSE